MPQIMRTIRDIMTERERDTLFIEFPGFHVFAGDRSRSVVARQRHFDWFTAHGVRWEAAAPRGWLEGDPGIYFLHIEPDTPEVAAYTATFENAEGKSLDPDAYRMILLPYADWLRAQDGRADD